MLPSVTQTTSASRIIRISGLITFTFFLCRLWPGIPSPQLHNSPLPGWVRGSVLRWWLAFPQAGFSPAGEYEFISALPRHLPIHFTDHRFRRRQSYDGMWCLQWRYVLSYLITRPNPTSTYPRNNLLKSLNP